MDILKKQLNKAIPIPLYYQLKSIILEEIKTANPAAGTPIPTEKQFQEAFQISRTTIRQALSELIQEGWLYRDSTKGTFVGKPKSQDTLIHTCEPFNQQILRTGQVPSTEVIYLEIIEANPHLAEKLGIAEKSKVISMLRRRFADEAPMVTMQNFIAYELGSFILEYDFTKESLYQVLSSREETNVTVLHRKVEALSATPEDSKYLGMKIKAPVLCISTVARNDSGRAVEYSIMRYRGDKVGFEVTIRQE